MILAFVLNSYSCLSCSKLPITFQEQNMFHVILQSCKSYHNIITFDSYLTTNKAKTDAQFH